MSIKRWRKADEILTICSFCLTIEKVGSGFLYHNAGQDAPPTGLVSYGSRYNPTAVLLYKVELRARLKNWNQSDSGLMKKVFSESVVASSTPSRSLSPSLSAQLIPRWGLGSRDCGVSTHLQNLYRTHYPFA